MTLYEDNLRVEEATRFRLTTRRSGADIWIIAVEGELDLFRTPALKDLFLELVGRGARAVVIDLGRTSFVDSTALALLMTLPRRIGRGGTVIAACDNPHVRKTFQITGTDTRLTLVEDVDHALERMKDVVPAA
jgi:anti-sigma B factor antagonist